MRKIASKPNHAPASRAARPRRIGTVSRKSTSYTSFAEQVKRHQARVTRISDRSQKRRENHRQATAHPGKGNTLLNYCGIRTDFIDYTVDRNPYKHGRFLPGTHIPIYTPEHIEETKPDYLLILPWNLKDEIMQQMRLHPRMGRTIRRAHSEQSRCTREFHARGARTKGSTRQEGKTVKVVLFCGGLGLRHPRLFREHPQASRAHRPAPHALARDEILFALRP